MKFLLNGVELLDTEFNKEQLSKDVSLLYTSLCKEVFNVGDCNKVLLSISIDEDGDIDLWSVEDDIRSEGIGIDIDKLSDILKESGPLINSFLKYIENSQSISLSGVDIRYLNGIIEEVDFYEKYK